MRTLARAGICLVIAAVPALAAPRLDYTLTCDSLRDRSVEVSLTITGWDSPSLSLRAVPRYMDNPLAEGKGKIVGNLQVADGDGRVPPGVRFGDGESGGLLLTVSPVPDTLVVTYGARVKYRHSRQTKDYPIHLPFMDKQRAWLYGNYLFCHPDLAASDPASLRQPADIRLRFELPAGIPLVGVPASTLRFANVYELLSLQFGLGEYLVIETEAGGQPVQLVFRDNTEFTERERDVLQERTAATVTGLVDFFGARPFPQCAFFYFRADGMGGLEGSFACQAYMVEGMNLADTSDKNVRNFTSIALHEFFHTWNPIALFALEDPWFKEAVTTYYGHVLALRLGFQELADYHERWERDFARLDPQALIPDIALTDPRIWFREYDGEDWRQLTYTRGHAVVLLLDVAIREASDNTYNFDQVLRMLVGRHFHRKFDHAELIDAIETATDFDPRPLFAEYVEGTSVPTEAQVRQALVKAETLGVFKGE